MKNNKEKLERYVKLVDEAILINDENKFDNFIDDNRIYLGVCFYLREYEKISRRGKRLIGRKFSNIPNYLKSFDGYWFKEPYILQNLKDKKESLLLRKQVVEYILEIYYPNSFKQLILNLWKRF